MNDSLDLNWNSLSSHPCITMDFIERYPDKPWDFELISENENLTLDFVLKHIGENFDWNSITSNSAITLDDIKKYPDLPWNFHCVGENPNIIAEFIRIFSETDTLFQFVNWNNIWSSEFIDIDFVLKVWNSPFKNKMKWICITSNPRISEQNILENQDLPWIYTDVSYNTSTSIEFICKHGSHGFLRYGLARHPKADISTYVTMFECPVEFIEYNPKVHESFDYIWKECSTFPSSKWLYTSLSKNEHLTFDIVRKNPNLAWSFELLSFTIDVSIEDIWNSRFTFPWNFSNLCENGFIKYRKRVSKQIERICTRNNVVQEELIQFKLHPTSVSKYLNKYEYNLGLDEYS